MISSTKLTGLVSPTVQKYHNPGVILLAVDKNVTVAMFYTNINIFRRSNIPICPIKVPLSWSALPNALLLLFFVGLGDQTKKF